MADRGSAVAYDAGQVLAENYQHPMEPTAAFGEATSTTADHVVGSTDYGHVFDGPAGATAFGEGYVDRSGTGSYMTPASTGRQALQGAPNGGATTEGTLAIQVALTGSSVGGSAVQSRIGRAFNLATLGSSGGATIGTTNIQRTYALEAESDGASLTAGRLGQAFGVTGSSDGSSSVLAELRVSVLQSLVGLAGGVASVNGGLSVARTPRMLAAGATGRTVVTGQLFIESLPAPRPISGRLRKAKRSFY